MPFSRLSSARSGHLVSGRRFPKGTRMGTKRQAPECQQKLVSTRFNDFTCQGGEGSAVGPKQPTVESGAGTASSPLCRRLTLVAEEA